MSDLIMAHTANAPVQQKARLSVALDTERKKALESYARAQNRSVHFVMLEMIDEKLRQVQEEAEYQEYIKNKVLAVYDRVEQKGSRGETSGSVFSRLRAEMKTYANEQGK